MSDSHEGLHDQKSRQLPGTGAKVPTSPFSRASTWASRTIVGGTIIFVLNPIFWVLTTIWLFTQSGLIEDLFPGFVYYAASFQLFLGNFIFVYLTVAGTLQRGLYSLTRYALVSPLYWGLMSIAAYRGFIQLFTKPFYWEKTEHGLDAGRTEPPGGGS